MVLTQGEKMVWAAAFANEWGRPKFGNGIPGSPRSAEVMCVEVAAGAIEALRRVKTMTIEDESHSQMLRAMLEGGQS